MFELNKVQRTKSGDLLKPFTVQGEMVLCADRNGNTVKVLLSDFDFSVAKEKEVISVQPSKVVKKIIEIDEDKNDDGLFSEDVQDKEIYMLQTDTEKESLSEREFKSEQVSQPEPVSYQEPEQEPEREPESTKTRSIWDTLDDDYL